MDNGEWKQETVEGVQYWINENLGNIIKSGDHFISAMPKVIKLGPFKTLEEAKNALLLNQVAVEELLETFNQTLLNGN